MVKLVNPPDLKEWWLVFQGVCNYCHLYIYIYSQKKINMEPQNEGLEDDFPLQTCVSVSRTLLL